MKVQKTRQKIFGIFCFVIVAMISFSFFSIHSKAEVGVGLQWSFESFTLSEFEEKCVKYKVYNPFSDAVNGRLEVQRDVAALVTKIEPADFFLKDCGSCETNKEKLDNNIIVTVCFKAPSLRFPPFYPKEYKGVVLATSNPIKIEGATGSATGTVVQAPLTITVGDMKTFYNFIIILSVTTAAVIITALAIKRRLPLPKQKYCEICKKNFGFRNVFCPRCGKRLKEKAARDKYRGGKGKGVYSYQS